MRLAGAGGASDNWGVAVGCAPNVAFAIGGYELRFDVSSIIGPRPNMEDRWCVAVAPDASAAVFAVFDGHGGAQVSHFLANALHAKLLADETLRTDPRQALRNACASCDEEIVRAFAPPDRSRWAARPGSGGPGPGSTAVVALLVAGDDDHGSGGEDGGGGGVGGGGRGVATTDTTTTTPGREDEDPASAPGDPGSGGRARASARNTRMFAAVVGDSRLIAADDAGAIVFESADQRPSAPEERARVLALGGTVRVSGGVARACGILAVSRAFGNAGIKHCVRADPEVTEVDLARVDTCVLCSDGLTDVVDAEKMLECARGFGGSFGAGAAVCGDRTSFGAASLGSGGGSARKRERGSVGGAPGEAAEDLTPPSSAKSRRGSGGGAVGPRGGVRRVANALTSLAKMRQTGDNVTSIVLRARRVAAATPATPADVAATPPPPAARAATPSSKRAKAEATASGGRVKSAPSPKPSPPPKALVEAAPPVCAAAEAMAG